MGDLAFAPASQQVCCKQAKGSAYPNVPSLQNETVWCIVRDWEIESKAYLKDILAYKRWDDASLNVRRGNLVVGGEAHSYHRVFWGLWEMDFGEILWMLTVAVKEKTAELKDHFKKEATGRTS